MLDIFSYITSASYLCSNITQKQQLFEALQRYARETDSAINITVNCSFRPKMPTNGDIDLQIILNPNTVCVGIYQNSRRKWCGH